MNGSFCEDSLQYMPTHSDLRKLRTTFVVNCVFNIFLNFTAIMFNTVTMYAMRKTSSLPKTLKTLLLSLAVSDVGVGLFVQPLHTFILIKWSQLKNPSCNISKTILGSLFTVASFFGVVAISVDRFLAIHLHLRYQQLVTPKRVVVVVISIWIMSALISSIILWESRGTRDFIISVGAGICFTLSLMVYIRIYVTVRRLKNRIHSIQVREEAQSGEMTNLASLVKTTVGIFFVYFVFLVCYLPYFTIKVVIKMYGASIVSKHFDFFSLTLVYLNSSLNPVIYCWKMRHIRHAIMDILRNMPLMRKRPRLIYNRSSNVVHVDN